MGTLLNLTAINISSQPFADLFFHEFMHHFETILAEFPEWDARSETLLNEGPVIKTQFAVRNTRWKAVIFRGIFDPFDFSSQNSAAEDKELFKRFFGKDRENNFVPAQKSDQQAKYF